MGSSQVGTGSLGLKILGRGRQPPCQIPPPPPPTSPSSVALDLNNIIESENEDKQSKISVPEKQNRKPDDTRQLERARSNAKGTLSKRQNNIIELILDTNNWQEQGKRLVNLEKALEKIRLPLITFHSTLSIEDDIF